MKVYVLLFKGHADSVRAEFIEGVFDNYNSACDKAKEIMLSYDVEGIDIRDNSDDCEGTNIIVELDTEGNDVAVWYYIVEKEIES